MFKDAKINISYTTGKTRVNTTVIPEAEIELTDLKIKTFPGGNDNQMTVDIFLEPVGKIVLNKFELIMERNFSDGEKIFLNGYQSWTDSFEHDTHEKEKTMPIFGKIISPIYHVQQYGDYAFSEQKGKAGEFHGFTYGYVQDKSGDIELIGSLSEKYGFTTIDISVPDSRIKVAWDCSGLHLTEEKKALSLFYAKDNEVHAFDLYFNAMNLLCR